MKEELFKTIQYQLVQASALQIAERLSDELFLFHPCHAYLAKVYNNLRITATRKAKL